MMSFDLVDGIPQGNKCSRGVSINYCQVEYEPLVCGYFATAELDGIIGESDNMYETAKEAIASAIKDYQSKL